MHSHQDRGLQYRHAARTSARTSGVNSFSRISLSAGPRRKVIMMPTLPKNTSWICSSTWDTYRYASIGFLVPTSQTAALIAGMGDLTAPNGDLPYWPVAGSADLTGRNGATISAYFMGGTGGFEYAVGRMSGNTVACIVCFAARLKKCTLRMELIREMRDAYG
jgi:hypothetical protein